MVIKDLRKKKYLHIDIKEIIEQIILNSPNNLFHGLDRILILDTDYKKRALGRHRWMKDGSFEIEIMIDVLGKFPNELLLNKEIITYQIGLTLLHELYHHKNDVNNIKTKKKKKDEKLADEYADQMMKIIIRKIYTEDEINAVKEKVIKLKNNLNND